MTVREEPDGRKFPSNALRLFVIGMCAEPMVDMPVGENPIDSGRHLAGTLLCFFQANGVHAHDKFCVGE